MSKRLPNGTHLDQKLLARLLQQVKAQEIRLRALERRHEEDDTELAKTVL
jgi:hypothetical protein